MLGVSKGWVGQRIRAGELQGFIVGRHYRIPRAALELYEETLRKSYREEVDNGRGMFARKKWGEAAPTIEKQKVSV